MQNLGLGDYRSVVEVRLNGEPREVVDGATVADLLETIGIGKRRVAVELNREIVTRDAYAMTRIRGGDVIEVVQFVGGG